MRNKILLAICLLLIVVLVIVRSCKTSFFYNEEQEDNIDTYIKVLDVNNNKIFDIKMEDYILGVVAGEMPASFNMEALKSQAIASRTYAYYQIIHSQKDYDVKSDKSSQVYLSTEEMKAKWGNDYNKYLSRIRQAVNDTKNLVITYDDSVIEAFYFAMGNGYTENSENVFSENLPYLKSVESYENNNIKNFTVTKTIDQLEFCNLLNIECDSINISNIVRSDSNRVLRLDINDKSFEGTRIRKLLNLRSTDFYIEINDNELTITTNGYGHGVGMSEYGANIMANNGKNFNEILKHYYSNVQISDINSINI